jgi:hypothetical protein
MRIGEWFGLVTVRATAVEPPGRGRGGVRRAQGEGHGGPGCGRTASAAGPALVPGGYTAGQHSEPDDECGHEQALVMFRTRCR